MISSIDWSPIIATIMGVCLTAIIGGFFGYVYYTKQCLYRYKLSLYNKYLNLVQEVAKVLEDNMQLSFRSDMFVPVNTNQLSRRISKLYFENILLFPDEVKADFLCLSACINSGGKYIWQIGLSRTNRQGKVAIHRCETKEDLHKVIDKLTFVNNEGTNKFHHIIDEYGKLREQLVYNFQSRSLMLTLQKYADQRLYFKWIDTICLTAPFLQSAKKKINGDKEVVLSPKYKIY